MPSYNLDNLLTPDELTPDQRRANAVKAGKASGEARGHRKRLRQALERILTYTPAEDTVKRLQCAVLLDNPDITVDEAIALAQVARALKGDTRAATWVRDTAGEKPSERMEAIIDGGMDVEVRISMVGGDMRHEGGSGDGTD